MMENGHIERTFRLSPGVAPTIIARSPIGAITIQGEERDDVAVHVTVEPADALGRDFAVNVEQRGEIVAAEVRGPSGGDSLVGWLRGHRNARITIVVRTPTRSNAEADGASASVQIEGLTGTIRVRTASGDIRADRLANDVTIQSASGDVRAHALSGSIRIATASGDLILERADGELTLNSASGDLILDRIMGVLETGTASGDCNVRSSALRSCRAKTASGDLQIATPLAQGGEYEFTTVSGDLALLVPGDTRATVAMKTVSGDLSCTLPATSDGGKRNRTLTINGGGVAVRVKTVSGDCTLRAADNLPTFSAESRVAAAGHSPAHATSPVNDASASPRMETPPQAHAANAPENGFSETLAVLQAVERGELTIDEAMEKLSTLEGNTAATQTDPTRPID